ncbi:hypothetical protein [Nocardioides daeguensis]|uniref:DUF4430 domain-containing protein n=1 Tax=Nocardioides daeguensis TaxID=908359 RepID=A0ABP6WJU9_9ACTN|nr:hypothetical protein [Nocardioides daeguensis]MBV6729102.1 hypothetical protein [Nocardioides daeguensis]MCR1774894.1 hypothetical protein [Nocardioides daeguensis]
MTFRNILRTAAATILVAAAVVLLPQATATAAACSGSAGITVVVDSNQLGTGISAGCDPDGGTAANNFADAGYAIEYSQAAGMSGFVCKVNGRPADGDCTETDAYWSLWWSDGKDGTWTYASRGVGSLRVPDGGYVAFAWHQGSGRAVPPDVVPTPRVVEPKPTPSPSAAGTSGSGGKKKPSATKKPTPKPSAGATSTSPTASATPSPSPSATSATPTEASTSPVPTDVPSQTQTTGLPSIDEVTDGPEATAADADSTDGGGFPAWLGIGLVVVVLGAAGAVPLIRRRKV